MIDKIPVTSGKERRTTKQDNDSWKKEEDFFHIYHEISLTLNVKKWVKIRGSRALLQEGDHSKV